MMRGEVIELPTRPVIRAYQALRRAYDFAKRDPTFTAMNELRLAKSMYEATCVAEGYDISRIQVG